MSSADELRAAATELRTQANGGFHPLLADWLDSEADMLDHIEPWVELLNAAITTAHGDERYTLKLLKNEHGEPEIVGGTDSAAFRLARAINGGAS